MISVAAVVSLSVCTTRADEGVMPREMTSVNEPSSSTSSTTTSTTVFKGKDCTKARVSEHGSKIPKSKGNEDEWFISLSSYRSYVRRLALPTVQREQDELVISIRDLISARTRSIVTRGRQQSNGAALVLYQEALLHFQDAFEDFLWAFTYESPSE